MLSGRLPYGVEVAKSRTVAAQRRLRYESVLAQDREIPAWIDEVLRKAVHPDPEKRYESLSEFVFGLRHPSADFLNRTRPVLIDRNPALFWKSVSLMLAILLFVLLFVHNAIP
jgi:hypothetical protein